MVSTLTILQELHRLRRHTKGLQEEIERTPRLLRARQQALMRQEEELNQAREKLNKTKAVLRSQESDLKAKHQQIKKFEGQLREISSKKEYDALQHEIAEARVQCGILEDAILDTMSQVEEQEARLPQIDKTLKQTREDNARFEAAAQQRLALLTEELQKTLAALKDLEVKLPEDIKPHYDRLVAAQGEDAMSLVKDNICTACYTAVTQQNMNDLMTGRLLLCKSCGRILYLAEEALSQSSA